MEHLINKEIIIDDPNDRNQLLVLFQKTLDYFKCRDGSKLVFFSMIGSRAFNLNIESSDQDFLGIFELDIDRVLSLESYKSAMASTQNHRILATNNQISNSNPIESLVIITPDVSVHEIKQFCKFILTGIPKITESLYLDRYNITTQQWEIITKNRDSLFLTQVALDHYISTVKALVLSVKENVEGGKGRDSLNDRKNVFKQSYHAYRLLREMIMILKNKTIITRFQDDDPDRKLLLSIRQGQYTEQQCYDIISEKLKEFEVVHQQHRNSLVEKVDIHFLNNWLVSQRRQSIKESIARDGTSFSAFTFTESDNNLYKKGTEYLKQYNVDATLLYFGKSGSNLYNLIKDENNTNDQDYFGFFAAPTDQIVSLFPPIIKIDVPNNQLIPNEEYISVDLTPPPNKPSFGSKDAFAKGVLMYEIGYVMALLMNSSNRLTECLFVPNDDTSISYQSNAWIELKQQYTHFLNRNLAQQYWGLSKSEFQKITELQRKSKNGLVVMNWQEVSVKLHHIFRLLLDCNRIINGQTPIITYPSDNENRQFLISLKYPNQDITEVTTQPLLDQCKRELESTQKKVNQMKPFFRHEFLDTLNPWLIKLRKSL
ncbi:hypothetical protein DLAC_08966 [Tieghemostelium lacteum]|uniref:Uncharacterized protein n=1 Tax=Tieghemostelium lacteum TaxID=361077 RepID=A0A151Z8U8_TIELA|nr:hypothetical protein DLAC_08966 [Tieghemostelium lacteum]|eukprot:KYQ90351.1 hypothetical protein DLAC_08966 [Tieghemostelium lacteum]